MCCRLWPSLRWAVLGWDGALDELLHSAVQDVGATVILPPVTGPTTAVCSPQLAALGLFPGQPSVSAPLSAF